MAMFVYRPIRPTDKAYIFAGSIVTVNSGITYLSGSTSVDSRSTVTLGTPFLAVKSTPVSVDSRSTFAGFSNRKYTSAVSVDSGSNISINFVPLTSISVYNEGAFKANTRDLNFSGSTVTVLGDIVTNTTTAGAEEVPYATRIDEISASLLYKAEATPGSADASAVWRISRLTFATDGDVTIEWAGGTSAFDKVWNDRLGLSYS
jgi:hypothetical protein